MSMTYNKTSEDLSPNTNSSNQHSQNPNTQYDEVLMSSGRGDKCGGMTSPKQPSYATHVDILSDVSNADPYVILTHGLETFPD